MAFFIQSLGMSCLGGRIGEKGGVGIFSGFTLFLNCKVFISKSDYSPLNILVTFSLSHFLTPLSFGGDWGLTKGKQEPPSPANNFPEILLIIKPICYLCNDLVQETIKTGLL